MNWQNLSNSRSTSRSGLRHNSLKDKSRGDSKDPLDLFNQKILFMKQSKIRPLLKISQKKIKNEKTPIFIDSDLSSIQELETMINPSNRRSECHLNNTHKKQYKNSNEFIIEPIKLRSPTVKTFKEGQIDQDQKLVRSTVKSSLAANS